MGYMHIDNLYRDDRIFRFPECYALEKIHGTSAHIGWDGLTGNLTFYAGGEKYESFVALFNQDTLRHILGLYAPTSKVTIYGEAYGGKQQGMRATYGDVLKFVVFDIRVNEEWRNVMEAASIAALLSLEFVDFARIDTKLSSIDAERDKPSTQAIRNGITEPKKREGVVLRPTEEARDDRGNRIIAKHKNVEFMETKTPRFVDPDKLQVLKEANAIADEWVTPMRLQHVLGRMPETFAVEIQNTGVIVKAMIEDVTREAKGEIVESKDAMRAIGSATARLYKKWLNDHIAVRSSHE